jgi:hypothetical protein
LKIRLDTKLSSAKKSEIIGRGFLVVLRNDAAVHEHGHVDPAMAKQSLQLRDGAALAEKVIREGVAESVAVESPFVADLGAHPRKLPIVRHHRPRLSVVSGENMVGAARQGFQKLD